jgi:hypothetical protein
MRCCWLLVLLVAVAVAQKQTLLCMKCAASPAASAIDCLCAITQGGDKQSAHDRGALTLSSTEGNGSALRDPVGQSVLCRECVAEGDTRSCNCVVYYSKTQRLAPREVKLATIVPTPPQEKENHPSAGLVETMQSIFCLECQLGHVETLINCKCSVSTRAVSGENVNTGNPVPMSLYTAENIVGEHVGHSILCKKCEQKSAEGEFRVCDCTSYFIDKERKPHSLPNVRIYESAASGESSGEL